MPEHIIWSNENLDLEDWRDGLLETAEMNEEDPESLTEDELYERMIETNNNYLGDERLNLRDVVLNRPILHFAELGLWNGVHMAVRLIKSGKVSDCLQTSEDGPTTWFVDEHGEFRARIHHHDGTNLYMYRGIRPGISDTAIESLCEKYASGRNCDLLIKRLTYRLGDLIGDVYGWEFPNRPKLTRND